MVTIAREILQFDYGTEPRGPEEESLGGNFSKAVALANELRELLSHHLGWSFSEVEVADFGATMWIENSPPPPLRSITVEPVVGMPLRWKVIVQEYKGCLGFLVPGRFDRAVQDEILSALNRITESAPFSAARSVEGPR